MYILFPLYWWRDTKISQALQFGNYVMMISFSYTRYSFGTTAAYSPFRKCIILTQTQIHTHTQLYSTRFTLHYTHKYKSLDWPKATTVTASFVHLFRSRLFLCDCILYLIMLCLTSAFLLLLGVCVCICLCACAHECAFLIHIHSSCSSFYSAKNQFTYNIIQSLVFFLSWYFANLHTQSCRSRATQHCITHCS